MSRDTLHAPARGALSDSAFRAAVEAMTEGVVVHDATGAIVAANEAAQDMLGLPLAVMQGRQPIDPTWRLLHPDGTPLPAEAIPSQITLRTGNPCRGVRLLVVRAGAPPIWLLVNTALFRDASGAVLGCVATFLDRTAEVQSERQRDEARKLLESITRAVPGALYQFLLRPDGTGQFLYASPQTRVALGLDPEEALHDAGVIWRRVHPEDLPGLRDALMATFGRVLAGDGTPGADQMLHEFRFERTPGEWRWYEARASGVRVADGALFQGFTHDVTERHLLASRLRDSQREELTGQLAAGLSHNFNNMLSVILPNLETLLREVPEALRVEVEDAHRAAHNAAELVRQLMHLVRNDAARSDEVVDVGMLVHQVLRICRRTFDRRITIEEDVPAAPMPVRAGRAALEQVLLNLCLNARDAMEGVVAARLHVRVYAGHAPGMVRLEVEDNGCGMTDDVRQRLAEPFFTTKPPGRGTGLGLTSAFSIVRELGGRIEVESTVGVGTVFRMCLPLATAAPATVLPTAAPATLAGASPPHGAVLVIDDEQLIRATASRMLTRLGYTPVLAEDGPRGLAALERHPDVAAIIVDVSMPGMSGPEVLARVRAARPALPVILSSGYLADGVDVSTASAVLTKPYESTALASVLARVLPPRAAAAPY